jgi:putative component of membrane protein insertase Oxa1/YidC/SpoIIIJ protein YidD
MVVDTSLPCQEDCGGAILAAQAAAFRSELDQYATGICPTLPATCGFGPSCAALTRARCAIGTCRPTSER